MRESDGNHIGKTSICKHGLSQEKWQDFTFQAINNEEWFRTHLTYQIKSTFLLVMWQQWPLLNAFVRIVKAGMTFVCGFGTLVLISQFREFPRVSVLFLVTNTVLLINVLDLFPIRTLAKSLRAENVVETEIETLPITAHRPCCCAWERGETGCCRWLWDWLRTDSRRLQKKEKKRNLNWKSEWYCSVTLQRTLKKLSSAPKIIS